MSLDTLRRDLRYGWRLLRARPGLSALAVLTLSLGIGANGAVFSVVSAVLLRPLPYVEPERLVMLWETVRDAPDLKTTSLSNYFDYRDRSRAVEAWAAWQRPTALTLASTTPAETATVTVVTAGFFEVLGVAPRIGRGFLPEEGTPGRNRVTVISHGLWQRLFGAARDPIGSTLTLEDGTFEIVGVMPSHFRSPAGEADLWLPLAMTPNAIDRGQNYLHVIARLDRGATVREAQAEMDGIAAALAAEYPATNGGAGVRLAALADHVVGRARPMLLIVLGAVAFALLIACANVGGLQLIKAAAREREIAIRLALGATPSNIVRQLLTESLLLALVSGAGGILAGRWALDLILTLAAGSLPRAEGIRLDGIGVSFILAVALATGVLAGLAPALYGRSAVPGAVLQAGPGRGTTGAVRHRRWRQGLAVAQVAVTLVLLAGAGLLVKSLGRLRAVDPGFDARDLLVARLTLGPAYDDPERRVAYFDDLSERLEALPGVRDVGAVTVLPMSPFGIDFDVPYHAPGTFEPDRDEAPKARFRAATPGYFAALGTPLLAGRAFGAGDRADTPRVVIVNRTLARRVWPGQQAVGRRLRFFWADWQTYEVVGVVADMRSDGPPRGPSAELFVPYAQNPYLVMNLIVRADQDAAALAPAVRAGLLEVDPRQPARHVTTMQDLLADSIGRETMAAALVSALAAMATLLAVTGIYGVIAHAVGQRTREIAIRIALGARRRDIVRLVVGAGLRLTVAGVGLGLLAAAILARTLKALLFEVAPTDPAVLLMASILLAGVALLACYLPARRAARIDPAIALNRE